MMILVQELKRIVSTRILFIVVANVTEHKFYTTSK